MKRWIFLVLLLVLPGLIFGCGKGKEASKHEGHKEEVKQEAKQEAKNRETDLEMKRPHHGVDPEGRERCRRYLRGRSNLSGKTATDRGKNWNG